MCAMTRTSGCLSEVGALVGCQAIDAACRNSKNPFARLCRFAFKPGLAKRNPTGIVATKVEHRPIASPKKALGPEGCEEMIKPWAQIGERRSRHRFGQEAGDLATDIAVTRQTRHVPGPALEAHHAIA